jgi:ubiquitin-protein ligase E3 C
MGIDGGGVFKEFFTDLSKEVFDSDRGLWLVNKKNELYPNHGSYATQRKHFPNAVPITQIKFYFSRSTQSQLVPIYWQNFGQGALRGYLGGRRVCRLLPRQGSTFSFGCISTQVLMLPLLQWLGKQSFLDDLVSLDPDLYQGLIFLKHYPGNPEELSLNFTIVDEGGIRFRTKIRSP